MTQTYEVALARYEDLVSLIETQFEYMTTDHSIRESVPMGIYEHFKSTTEQPRFYMVEEVGRVVENGPYLVSYRSLYGPYARQLAFRHLVGPNPFKQNGKLDGFLMPVRGHLDYPEYIGQRFTLVRPARDLAELRRLAKKYDRTSRD